MGEYEKPQALIVLMLSRIISGLVAEGEKNGPELYVERQVKNEGASASVSFRTDALRALSGICDMELGELQSAVQSSLETALLDMYEEHKGRQQLH